VAADRDPVTDIEIINRELRRYEPALAERPQMIVLNKQDAIQDDEIIEKVKSEAARLGTRFLLISAVTGEGLPELIAAAAEALDRIDGA
jgi:GTP-binding protein